jgi:hypothetical protein
MLTRNSIWYSILALTHHHANCPDDPLRPAAHRQQVGVSTGTTARGLFARPGDERLDADRTRCRREARFRTRPGRFGLSRIEPPGRARRPIHGHREARQVGREYVPLHRDATIAAVNPFGQKLARDDTAETGLGESQRRGEDGHARTGASSLARERRHKRRRGSTSSPRLSAAPNTARLARASIAHAAVVLSQIAPIPCALRLN